MKRFIIIGMGLLALVVIGVVVYVLLNVNPLVKYAINTYGPKVTQTDVSVDDVSLSVFSGQGSLADLSIGNPKGFQEKTLMSLGKVEIGVDLGSVSSDQIVIDKVVLLSPKVTYEQTGKSPSNFEVLMDNIKQTTSGGQKEETAEAPAEKGKEKTLLVKDFWLKDGQVTLAMTGLAGESMTVDLPTIHLTDVGGDTPPEAVVQEIMDAIFKTVQQSILDFGVAIYENGGLVAKEALGFVEGAAEGVGGAVQDVGEGAGDAASDALKGVEDVGKSLFQ